MDMSGRVPCVAEEHWIGHSSLKQEVQPVSVESKVREGYDLVLSNPFHLLQQYFRVHHHLYSHIANRVIELIFCKWKGLIDICLYDVESFSICRLNTSGGDLHPCAGATLLYLKQFHKRAISTAKVYDSSIWLNKSCYQGILLPLLFGESRVVVISVVVMERGVYRARHLIFSVHFTIIEVVIYHFPQKG